MRQLPDRSRTTQPPSRRVRLAGSDGFTLIEVMIATFVLVVALLGSMSLLSITTRTSAITKAREGAVNLDREITEDARSLPYWGLTNSNLTSQLQALPGLANQASGGSSWQIIRRGVTYTVTATEADLQSGTEKQVTVGVQYTIYNRSHSVQEVTTLASSTPAGTLVATNLVMATPAVGSGNAGTASQPIITSSSVTSATFSVTAPSGTSSVVWTVNGVQTGWSSTVSGTTYTSSSPWLISSLSDGTYTIGAAAESANGTVGPTTTIQVKLARGAATAPNVTNYGYNTNFEVSGHATTAAEFQWQANPQLNVVGYRIYNPSGTLLCQTSNTTSYTCAVATTWCPQPTYCVDTSPPSSSTSNLTYTIAAIYYDSSGTIQQSPSASVTLTGWNTFKFAPTTGNTGSNCPAASMTRDMSASYTPGGSQSSDTSGSDIFCSDAFTAGQSVIVGGSATVYLADASNRTCTVTGTLSVDGTTSPQTATVTVPSGSATTKYMLTWSNNTPTTMNAGDRLDTTLTYSGCSNGNGKQTTLYWGSSSTPSQFASGVPQPPNPVTGLSLTRTNGVATLTWTPPSSGTSPSFYRIYRDGSNYGNRYDTLDASSCSTTCSYTDPKTDTSSHTYYVTSVGGSTPGANMAESTMSAGVTG